MVYESYMYIYIYTHAQGTFTELCVECENFFLLVYHLFMTTEYSSSVLYKSVISLTSCHTSFMNMVETNLDLNL